MQGSSPVADATKEWLHPGGKLRERGAHNLEDSELLAILISSGTKGRPAEVIARDIVDRFGSLGRLANQPLEALLEIKGLGDVKILRIAAALEIARRATNEMIREKGQETK
jgi:DNA repair protein RadC